MSDFDFLRIDKSSGQSLLRPANTQGYASSSTNLSCVNTEVSFLLQETISLTDSH